MSATNATLEEVKKRYYSGQLKDAENLCRKLLKQNPLQSDALYFLGLINLNNQQYTQAIETYKKIITLNPDNADYQYNIGLAYLRSNFLDLAVNHLRTAIRLYPKLANAHKHLCETLVKLNLVKGAISSGKKAITLAPDDATSYKTLASAYDACGNFEAAFKNLFKAAQLQPDAPEIQFNLGNAYVSLNDMDAATKCFRNVLSIQPDNISAYGNIVRITKYHSLDNDDVTNIKFILSKKQLSDEERIIAHFSLGKIYQDCTLYDEAFKYYEKGNQLQDNIYKFNPSQPILATSLLTKHCTAKLISEKQKLSTSVERPIFIVGTPRSGTTLIEQIVSAHNDVFGAGELQWFPKASNELQELLNTSATYPQNLNELTKKAIKKLALKYSKYTHSLSNGETRIIDKLPGNFLHLGLILILFPKAKIIHCRREPRDSCISMYFERFPLGVPYSYNLYKLGIFYSQYEQAMKHWQEVLPAHSIIEIEYEKIIDNQKDESRRLLDFLELEWQESCLTFYKQKRSVRTASDTQVTKPIYSSSIGRWKHYEKHLKPLEEGFQYKGN